MHFVVCIKQVPNTADVKIDPETNTLVREGVESVINPFDMYAIEEALRQREAHGGKVTVISLGPPQAESALREAISLGADEGVLVSDRAFAGSDTWATSYTLSMALKKLGADNGFETIAELSVAPLDELIAMEGVDEEMGKSILEQVKQRLENTENV